MKAMPVEGVNVMCRAFEAPLQTAQPHRDHVRAFEGLTVGCNALPSVPEASPIRHRSCRSGHLIALTNNDSGGYYIVVRRKRYFSNALTSGCKLVRWQILSYSEG